MKNIEKTILIQNTTLPNYSSIRKYPNIERDNLRTGKAKEIKRVLKNEETILGFLKTDEEGRKACKTQSKKEVNFDIRKTIMNEKHI